VPAIIAHRGASAYELENTLAAFRKAVALGADGIELDVHATMDGAFVVHHDDEIHGRRIADHSLTDLRQHPLRNGEVVPTLEEALAAIRPDVDVYVEVKTLPEAHQDRFLKALGRGANVHVHAFDHRLVRRLVNARPGLSAGVLSASYPLDPVPQVRAAGANTLWQHRELVDAPLVAQAHADGVTVIIWTVNRPADARRLAALGVDGLCTDAPDRIREALA
jgi:glycerophosphoryl diester phosphodiesterase